MNVVPTMSVISFILAFAALILSITAIVQINKKNCPTFDKY